MGAGAPCVGGSAAPRGRVPELFYPKILFWALFSPNEVLEMHLAPFLNQLSAFKQNKFAGRPL